LNKKRS